MNRPFEQPWLLLLLAVLVVAVLVSLFWLRPRGPRRKVGGSVDAGTEPPTPPMGMAAADIQAALSEPELVGARAEVGAGPAGAKAVGAAPATSAVAEPTPADAPAADSMAGATPSKSAAQPVPVSPWVEPAPVETSTIDVPAPAPAANRISPAGLAGLAETELADDPALADEVETAPHSAMQGLVGISGELAASAASVGSPYGFGSALPGPDGSAPTADFSIKGNAASKLYHTTDSPYYGRTRADVWFRSEVDARRAGFSPWSRKSRQATAVQPPFEDAPYPGSAKPRSDGSAPTEEFTVKANEGSMVYHTHESPHYRTTRADVWFRSDADARRAGFTPWQTPH